MTDVHAVSREQALGRYESGMSFVLRSGSGHEVLVDVAEDHGGHNRGPRPIELVLMGLAGCTGMDVISLLKKMRQDVAEYHIEVTGIRSEDHPRVYTNVEVVHVVRGRAIDPAAVERAVRLSADKYCSVSAMLSWGAEVRHRHVVHQIDGEADT